MGRLRLLGLLCVLFVLGCDPGLPTPPGASSSTPAIEIEVVPPAPSDAVAPVSHFRLRSAARAGARPDAVALVVGEVGPRHVEQIAEGDPSDALSERIVPASVIPIEDDIWIVPHVMLERGERYDAVVGDTETTFPIVVDSEAEAPFERLWPPPDLPVAQASLFYCGPDEVSFEPEEDALFPDGPRGVWSPGTPSGAGRRCLRFDPAAAMMSGTWLAPPSVAGHAVAPGPVTIGEMNTIRALSCAGHEVVFGPGCAAVEDDRLTLRAPESPMLWVVSGGGLDLVFATEPGESRIVKGLPPSSSITLTVEVLYASGVWSIGPATVFTKQVRPHFVINEAYANPIGAEPDQEWIEIVNDGSVGGDLEGYVIEDIGGPTVLPAAFVGPGAMAVVVNETFSADGEYDAAPAPDAVIVRVEKLGKNGLSNSGEPLKLTRPDGTVISRFPAVPKPKPGASVARVTPEAPDGVESSFVLSTAPTPGAPN
ncbi:MAG: lamin tail domain-containing protein [Polyangiaceae bacterium]|nr:lamin tail domain-containing protein [Polyangiaceae bacterium]